MSNIPMSLLEQDWERAGQYFGATMPGLYPIIYLDQDNEVLCAKCATEIRKEVEAGDRFDWELVTAAFIHYEGASHFCSECNTEIESAYGDPEED